MAPVTTGDRSDLIYFPARKTRFTSLLGKISIESYGAYEMLKSYVLKWERNLVLESQSGKKGHSPVVVELGNMLEKVLTDFGKLFQRIGVVWSQLYELKKK